MKLTKFALVICLISTSFLSVLAQSKRQKINLKIAHSIKKDKLSSQPYAEKYYWHGEANYMVNKFIHIGVFVGNEKLLGRKATQVNGQTIGVESKEVPTYTIGLNTNLQLLPVFLKTAENLRFDLYFTTKLGREFSKRPPAEYEFYTNDKMLAQAGFGATYRFTKNIGLYTEYIFDSRAAFRYGLSIRF